MSGQKDQHQKHINTKHTSTPSTHQHQAHKRLSKTARLPTREEEEEEARDGTREPVLHSDKRTQPGSHKHTDTQTTHPESSQPLLQSTPSWRQRANLHRPLAPRADPSLLTQILKSQRTCTRTIYKATIVKAFENLCLSGPPGPQPLALLPALVPIPPRCSCPTAPLPAVPTLLFLAETRKEGLVSHSTLTHQSVKRDLEIDLLMSKRDLLTLT